MIALPTYAQQAMKHNGGPTGHLISDLPQCPSWKRADGLHLGSIDWKD
jgi:hypothetical protein